MPGMTLPETDRSCIRRSAGILQAASRASIVAADVALDQSAALQMFQHDFDQLWSRSEARRQVPGFQRPPAADFLNEPLKHIYNPTATAR